MGSSTEAQSLGVIDITDFFLVRNRGAISAGEFCQPLKEQTVVPNQAKPLIREVTYDDLVTVDAFDTEITWFCSVLKSTRPLKASWILLQLSWPVPSLQA